MVVGILVALVMFIIVLAALSRDLAEKHHIHLNGENCDYCKDWKGDK